METTETKVFTVFILLAAVLASWAALPASAADPVTPNTKKLAEVASGKRAEARVSWWGFDPADSTAALQAAINSRARKLIVENMGSPWITDKLTLAGNQEIFFEKGAVVQARRGAFHSSGDCLFSAVLKTNITLTGPGATLRMWKQDYDDKAKYTHAEWRHVLSFKSCAHVRVEGLTLADSGGDGIYLGVAQKGVPCSDVVIRKVSCVNNYRQGISVISARNLLIEDSVLRDTGGTAPEAGIDFEPNNAEEELVNCVMRRCVSENNRGDAYTFYLRPLRADSRPISIRIEDCRAVGSRRSVSFVTGNNHETAGVKGSMEFIKCRFADSRQAAISIADKPVTGASVRFAKCQVINRATNQPATRPIAFAGASSGVSPIGGVVFDRCTILDALDRPPMSYHDMSGGVALSNITGRLIVRHGSKQTTHRLTQELIADWMPFRSFKQIAPFDTKGCKYEPVLPGSKTDAPRHAAARQRGLSEWLIWAEAGEQVSFSVRVQPVGKGDPGPAPVRLLSPSGTLTKLPAAQGGRETAYEFRAAERGAFKIICEPQSHTATVTSPGHPVCLYSQSTAFHLLGTTGRFWFWVPPATKEFAVKVSGEGGEERVMATLYDPDGREIAREDSIAQAQQFVAKPRDTSHGETWSVRFDKPAAGVLEDVYVQLQGIPPLLSPAREHLLRPAN